MNIEIKRLSVAEPGMLRKIRIVLRFTFVVGWGGTQGDPNMVSGVIITIIININVLCVSVKPQQS